MDKTPIRIFGWFEKLIRALQCFFTPRRWSNQQNAITLI